MRAVITVIGKDTVGIIHAVTGVLKDFQINILDISQTIMQEFFSMIMIVDTSNCSSKFEDLQSALDQKGQDMGMSIRIQHEDIFNSMNQI